MKRKLHPVRVLVAVCLLAWMVCLLSGCTEDKAVLAPTDRFFVNDFADVLSLEAENQIYTRGVALHDQTGAQVVVVTVESMGGEPIEDFAYDLANEWGIGEAEKDTGVLLLLAVEEREVRIEVGSGLEGRLTDGKTGRILDYYAVPHLQEDDFSTGLQNAYIAIVNEIAYYEYGIELDEGYVPVDELPQEEEEDMVSVLAFVLVMVVLIVVSRFPHWALLHVPRGPHGGSGRFGGFGGHGGGGGFSGGGGGFSGGGSSRGF